MDSAKPKKNKAAQMLASLKWSKTTREERIAHSKKMNEAKKQKKVDSLNKKI